MVCSLLYLEKSSIVLVYYPAAVVALRNEILGGPQRFGETIFALAHFHSLAQLGEREGQVGVTELVTCVMVPPDGAVLW